MISGAAIVNVFITLLVFGVILYLCWWALDYFKPPEPINKVLRIILVIAALIIAINALLSLVGRPFIAW